MAYSLKIFFNEFELPEDATTVAALLVEGAVTQAWKMAMVEPENFLLVALLMETRKAGARPLYPLSAFANPKAEERSPAAAEKDDRRWRVGRGVEAGKENPAAPAKKCRKGQGCQKATGLGPEKRRRGSGLPETQIR